MQTCLANTNPINVLSAADARGVLGRGVTTTEYYWVVAAALWSSDKNLQKIFSYVKMCKV